MSFATSAPFVCGREHGLRKNKVVTPETGRSSPKEPAKTANPFPRSSGTAKPKRLIHGKKPGSRPHFPVSGCRKQGAKLLHAEPEEGGVIARKSFFRPEFMELQEPRQLGVQTAHMAVREKAGSDLVSRKWIIPTVDSLRRGSESVPSRDPANFRGALRIHQISGRRTPLCPQARSGEQA